jgi:hypothetical protein
MNLARSGRLPTDLPMARSTPAEKRRIFDIVKLPEGVSPEKARVVDAEELRSGDLGGPDGRLFLAVLRPPSTGELSFVVDDSHSSVNPAYRQPWLSYLSLLAGH